MTNRPTSLPIAIDLFAGAGGLAEGLESAGFHVAVAVELHPQPGLTHAFNHPNTRVLVGDIRNLSMDLLQDRLRRSCGKSTVDVVVGGPPCQGFSSAGKKVSEDPRNNLFRQFVRVVEHFRPSMFLLENVPGFKKMYDGFAYVQASEMFRNLGYKVDDRVLDTFLFGVPQKRQRFVMVGWLPDQVQPFVWPQPTNGTKPNFFDGEVLSPLTTVGDALGDLAFLEPGWEAHRHQIPPTTEFQVGRQNGCSLLFNHLATRHRDKAVQLFSHIPEGSSVQSVPPEYRTTNKRTMVRLDRRSISNAVLALPDDMIHYHHPRIPTVREMARLQTFDDDFVFIGKRTSGFIERRVDVPQYTQVGNAVPPLFGKALGRALLSALGFPERDVRDIARRRRRHSLVRGSSGYAGYTLDPKDSDEINLETILGETIPLPVSTEDTPVREEEELCEWDSRPASRRGQWAPGVTSRSVPSWMQPESEDTSVE